MGLSFRHYLFAEDGSLRRLPQRIVDELPSGRDGIPEFAGSRQRVAYVVIENRDGRPARILDARGEWWSFNDEGRVDEDMHQRMLERLDLLPGVGGPKRGPVVDLMPELKKREHQAKHEWTLTADDLDRIAADLWPGVHGPAPDVTMVKGKALRKPPLTTEGRWALERIEKHVEGIVNEMHGLSERALKGLAFEAHRTGTIDNEALWRGIEGEAKRQEAIRSVERTGRGEWYAVVEVSREDRDNPRILEHFAVAHVKAASRKAAIEAGRKLMAEKVEWLAEGTMVEVTLRSALEWQPEEWE